MTKRVAKSTSRQGSSSRGGVKNSVVGDSSGVDKSNDRNINKGNVNVVLNGGAVDSTTDTAPAAVERLSARSGGPAKHTGSSSSSNSSGCSSTLVSAQEVEILDRIHVNQNSEDENKTDGKDGEDDVVVAETPNTSTCTVPTYAAICSAAVPPPATPATVVTQTSRMPQQDKTSRNVFTQNATQQQQTNKSVGEDDARITAQQATQSVGHTLATMSYSASLSNSTPRIQVDVGLTSAETAAAKTLTQVQQQQVQQRQRTVGDLNDVHASHGQQSQRIQQQPVPQQQQYPQYQQHQIRNSQQQPYQPQQLLLQQQQQQYQQQQYPQKYQQQQPQYQQLYPQQYQQQQPNQQHYSSQQQPLHASTESSTAALVATGPAFVPRPQEESPVIKLSVQLIQTYKRINEVYYEAKRKRQLAQKQQQLATDAATAATAASDTTTTSTSSGSVNPPTQKLLYNDGHDDEHSDYIIKANEMMNGRYVIKQRIGRGSFGQVVLAFDAVTNTDVAVKIIKSKKPFHRQAKTEIELLERLNKSDPEDSWFIVRLHDTFVHQQHQCLVFEMLSYNLYDLLRNTNYNGVSLNLIRKFSRQILKALYHLSTPEIDIIHCDLKPENILLRHPRRSAIKLIDFGSSCSSTRKMYTYIQSRFYRSPEVILGLPYSVDIDMWSLGCILVEMHTGEPLFSGADELDQLYRMIGVLGPIPNTLLKNGTKVKQFFTTNKSVASTTSSDSTTASTETHTEQHAMYMINKNKKGSNPDEYLKTHTRNLENILGSDGNGPSGRRKGEQGHTPAIYALFLDLVKRMLEYDPVKRIKPAQALRHAFFNEENFKPTQPVGGASTTANAARTGSNARQSTLGQPQQQQYRPPSGGGSTGTRNTSNNSNARRTLQTGQPRVRRAKRPGSAPAKST